MRLRRSTGVIFVALSRLVSKTAVGQKLPRPRYPVKLPVEPPRQERQPFDTQAQQMLDEVRRLLAEERARKLWRELSDSE